MRTSDDFSSYLGDGLQGTYDCVDRISLRGYFPMGQASGGFILWWNRLYPRVAITKKRLRSMAGDFARRVRAFARKKEIPFMSFAVGDKTKHSQADALRPADPNFQGVFAIFASKAPALVWKAWKNKKGKLVLRRSRNWPWVYHYHFHIVDRQWGHLTIRMSGHLPFGLQISLNGHEWVERQARAQGVPLVKQENGFVGGSDFPQVNQLAQTLEGPKGLAQLAAVCERWVYSACLCFALKGEAQRRSGFRYQYSCYQVEYSRNLLFKRGRHLDEVYKGLIERTWRQLDVPRLKTIFGRRNRPHQNRMGGGRLERIVERFDYDPVRSPLLIMQSSTPALLGMSDPFVSCFSADSGSSA